MMVTYRLAGVDGEATEEVVDTLADSESAADQDPEVKFGIARDIAEVCRRVMVLCGVRRVLAGREGTGRGSCCCIQ